MQLPEDLASLIVPAEEYPTVDEGESVGTAITALRDYFSQHEEHRSMLVTRRGEGDDRQIVGILTVSDILAALKHHTRSYGDDEVSRMAHSLSDYGTRTRRHTEHDLRDGFDLKVEDLMPEDPTHIDASLSPADALQIMLRENAEMLLVAQGDSVVGVVRAIDLLQYIDRAWCRARRG